jgi:hypothetical protein
MLNELTNQFGVELAQDVPRVLTVGVVDLTDGFPELEKEFNLLAQAGQDKEFFQS